MSEESPVIIMDTFDPDFPPDQVVVDFATMSEQELAWRAVVGEVAAQEEFRRRHPEIAAPEEGRSARHMQGKHVQATHAGKGGGGVHSAADVAAVEAELGLGHDVEIDEAEVDALMNHMAAKPSTNLAHLQVRGEPNCYRYHAREIPRSQMPQLPENVAGLQEFSARLETRGISATLVQRDPRQLHMTQNQLDSRKVGTLYGKIREGGWRADAVLIADRDGDILDGHHRWAAASAARMSGVELNVSVYQVDTDIDTLLTVANEVSLAKVGMSAELGAGRARTRRARKLAQVRAAMSPPPSEDEPWLWIDGQWYLVVTDTSDGVPDSLDHLIG